MTKENLLLIINQFSKDYNLWRDAYAAEKLEIIFQDYLKNNPYDTEIWFKLALLNYLSALNAFNAAAKCLNTILSYEPNNIYAFLVLFYVDEFSNFGDEKLFPKLCSIQHSDPMIMSMVEYAKSWHFVTRKKVYEYEHEQALINSIKLCDKYVRNYEDLGRFYMRRGNILQGQLLMKKGLQNFEYVYDDADHDYNMFDLEEFFKERYQGVRLSSSNYKILLDSFDQNSFWVSGKYVMNADGRVTLKRGDGTNATTPQQEN